MSALAKEINVTTRQMTRDDLLIVMDIEKRSYVFPWNIINFEDCLRMKYENTVVLLGEEIIGYGIMAVAAGECHILNLCIDPKFQRQGYGCMLLQTMISHTIVLGSSYMLLEVRLSNIAAIKMYQVESFKQIGLRRGYYLDYAGREDALVLMLKL